MAVKISDLLPKAVAIPTGAGDLMVKALNLKGITVVLQQHRDAILQLVASSEEGKPNYAAALEQAPDMVASVIAMAADAEGQEEDIKQLPGTVQLMALAAIWKASVPDTKKFLDSLSEVMGQANSKSAAKLAAVSTAS